jgi:hypothetical protein
VSVHLLTHVKKCVGLRLPVMTSDRDHRGSHRTSSQVCGAQIRVRDFLSSPSSLGASQ